MYSAPQQSVSQNLESFVKGNLSPAISPPHADRFEPSHLILSICVTVNCPLVRSGTNRTLSPGLTFLSNCGSGTWKTIVIPSSIPNFLIGPCLIVIFSAVGSIFVTWPITASGDWAKVASGATPSANISVIMDRDDADVGAWCSAACDFRPVAGRGDGPGNKD